MVRSAIQLYTLRAIETPLPELLTDISDAGYEGVEFAHRVSEADADAVEAALGETGLESAAAHVGIDRLEDDLEGTLEFYRSLDCEHIVVPWLDPEAFETIEAIEETADRLQSVAASVESQGMDFSYHNHDHEFVEVEGETAFDRLADATTHPVNFELDCGWTTVGGANPAEVLNRLEDRISLVHISDADESGTPTEVGDGVLDVSACRDAVSAAGVEWVIYEHDDPTDAIASAAHGADVLDEF